MKTCPTCHQPIRHIKPQSINYTIFSSRCCGYHHMWVLPAGDRWKTKPYMEKYKLFPHQIKGAV